ncbi:unnamed protein product [Rangifer tarandus platyrhynchus]|uniref:Large ribosomal subunit protein mL53 n=1 Tax=Rangifer tarandus platyrhynchus TaxID=3082113 RepID=A0ABN8ZDA6_RANTA|nr:unnamed protein product [Rangifer tarandus platyrhynchus]CAI9688576.1 unnamed protein product [Rangifer tarandus platyrhynchus]
MAAALTGLRLRSVKQVRVQFCSFEKNMESTRTFHQVVSSEKVRCTNLNCSVIVDVRTARSSAPTPPGKGSLPSPPTSRPRGGGEQGRTAQKKPANRF